MMGKRERTRRTTDGFEMAGNDRLHHRASGHTSYHLPLRSYHLFHFKTTVSEEIARQQIPTGEYGW